MVDRATRVLILLSLLVAGCAGEPAAQRQSDGSGTTPITVQLNWYPEAEHGGVFQALADGTYAKAGLDVVVQPGGRATPVAPELSLGRAQFAFANADDVIVYRGQGIDVVAVLAALQDSPRCILVREESGVESFSDLAGMTLQRQAGRPFLLFMRAQGVLDQVQEVPYHGSVSSLVADPKIAIQAYSFAEPLLAEQQGVRVRRLMVSELGWNPYSSVLITTGDLIRGNPDVVRRFVQATQTGWQNYLRDPTLGNAAILAANEHGMTAEALQYGAAELRTLALPEDTPLQGVGRMTLERWTRLVEQFRGLDPGTVGDVHPADCFNTSFLP